MRSGGGAKSTVRIVYRDIRRRRPLTRTRPPSMSECHRFSISNFNFFFIPIIELGLFAILISYDRLRLKRPHWTSLFGLALFFAAMAAKLTLAQQPAWTDFAALLFT